MKKSIITDMISALLVFLFVYAAASKLLNYEQFSAQLSQSPLLSHYSHVVAVAIPLIEFGIVILLINSTTKLLGLIASFTLLILFTSYLIAVLSFSAHIPCSCGGILQGMSWKTHIAFNLIFIGFTIVGIVLLRSEIKRGQIIAYNALVT